jgi:peptidoglycan/LPS O-acetylase OafA/YrhL
MPAADIGMRLLSALFPSDAAVLVFFVLSGHVLWASFERKQLRFFKDLPEYACARIYRLFPLVIIGTMPLGLLSSASAAELVNNMLLLSHSMNGVLWSLQVEVVASFALFALWGLTRGSGWRLLAAVFLAFWATRFARGNAAVVFFPAFVWGRRYPRYRLDLWRGPWIVAGGTVVLVCTNIVLGHGGITRIFEMAELCSRPGSPVPWPLSISRR